MATQQVPRPKKVDFISQKDIDLKNRQKRIQVLRAIEELRISQKEAAATAERH